MNTLHPFSKIDNQKSIILSAENYNILADDKIYLDAISGLYNCPLGYSVESIKCKMTEALSVLPCCHIFSSAPNISQQHPYLINLNNTLSKLIPFSKNIFFTNSGSEAVDSALNLCRRNSTPSKSIILSYNGSYHGSTFSGLAASGNLSQETVNNRFIDFYNFYDDRMPQEYLLYIENKILEIGPDNILAFVIEPFIGASGGFFMKENILPELKILLNKYQIYFILDEVISGFGRLGTMFSWQKYDVQPDVLILSKAITNGYAPLACCITSLDFDENSMVSFGYTTAGNPISCAAAVASISLIKDAINNGTIYELEKSMQDKIMRYKIHNKCYKIEVDGLFIALHFSQDKNRYIPYADNIGGKIALKIREKGIIVRGNPKSLIFSPGYYMTEFQIDRIIKTIAEIL